jgi:hypothetical protein
MLPSALQKGFQYSILQNTPAQKAVHNIQLTSFPKGGTQAVIRFLTGSMIVELTMMVVIPYTAIIQTKTLTKYSIKVVRVSYLSGVLSGGWLKRDAS